MRMILPTLRERAVVDALLTRFFRDYHLWDFRRAVGILSRFFHLKTPQVDWFEYLDWGKTAGRCYEDGRIHLVHPENWKRGRKYNTERQWINTVYHELGHYVFWSDAERKADTFAYKWVRGVAANGGSRTLAVVGVSRARRKRDVTRSRPRHRPRPARSR
ncbi:MAG: hypothetical protein U0807_08450 [Candidatus Binatia bacterium]